MSIFILFLSASKGGLEGCSLGFGVRPLNFLTGQDGRQVGTQGVNEANGDFTR
jgi:hypothetical protein